MAEVRKKQTTKKYNVEKMLEEEKTKNKKKNNTNKVEKEVSKAKKDSTKKKSLWTRFMIFCHGVKNEFNKVFWPTKKDMVKYSIATIVFIIFCGLFFYAIDIIFALIKSLV